MVNRDGSLFGNDRKPRKVFENWPFQIELAFVVQREARQSDERLADGADLEQMVRRDGFLLFEVGIAERGDACRAFATGERDPISGP